MGGCGSKPEKTDADSDADSDAAPEPSFPTKHAKKWYERELSGAVVRKSAHDLTSTEVDRIVKAWLRMMESEDGVPGSSQYFRLALIHGGSQARQTYLSETDDRPGFCIHNRECFPNWHRVYMLDFEQTLRCADIDLGGDGNIGLPYWDWTTKPEGKTMLPMLAQKLMAQTVGSQGQGLFPDDFLPLTRAGHQVKAIEPDGTPFYKTMVWTNDLDRELEWNLSHRGYDVAGSQRKYLLMHQHRRSSLALDARPHGSTHVALGSLGRRKPGTEMIGSIPTASYHPIFWLHHCNVDRVYESFLAIHGHARMQKEFRRNARSAGTAAGFPKGQTHGYEPWYSHAHSREVMRGTWTGDDTFNTEAMGFTYASLAQVGGGRRRRDLPVLAQFNDVPKVNVDGSKALYVYVSDAGDGDDRGGFLGFLPFLGSPKKGQPSWQPPSDLESAAPADLTALPGFAGIASLFVLPTEGTVRCDNCVLNSPTCSAEVDVTEALKEAGIPRARAVLHALAFDIATQTAMTLEQAGVPPPELCSPTLSFEVDVSEGSEDKEEVVALQMLLNAVFTTSLKVDGVVGKVTADAIKAAQAAAALPEDGVAGPKTKAALLLASAALSAAPQADERYKEVVQRLLVAAKAEPVRWTLRRDDEPGDEGRDEWMDAAQVELERAFVAWSKTCRPSSLALESLPTISFEYTAEEADAHILLSFAELATAHEARDGPGGKLAQTTAASEGSFPLVHIAFDEGERWELADLPHPQRADGTLDDEFFFQLLPVAIREIGLALGLGLSLAGGALDTMSPFYAAGNTTVSARAGEELQQKLREA